jgi:uncharacterized protein YjbJ (UPF0337 family)
VSSKRNRSGPREGAKGVVEHVKGKAKEAAGAVTGEDSLRDEGRAQQDKARAQRQVAAKEADADRSRAEARMHESAQRAHQR